jgi:hypothetical protein
LSFINEPGHSNFITSNNDWRGVKNDSLWQGINGVNNPCPIGFRIPTSTEWNIERISWSTYNHGVIESILKLPLTGIRYSSNGSLGSGSIYGQYWSSTVSGINSTSQHILISKYISHIYNIERANGLSVRCIKD